jgi:Rrf2 family protein
MKLSLRCEYALRALIALGQSRDGNVVRIQSISEQQDIPQRFLAQILNDLRAGGFVESKRGKEGGYRLARTPREITMAPVIRHIEGKLIPAGTLGEKPSRGRVHVQSEAATKAINSVMKDVGDAIVKVLDEVTLAELCERSRRLSEGMGLSNDYSI